MQKSENSFSIHTTGLKTINVGTINKNDAEFISVRYQNYWRHFNEFF